MLETAQLHKERLEKGLLKTWYDLDYMYYHSSTGSRTLAFDDDNYNKHAFASVGKDGVAIGYISYSVDWKSMVAHNFGIINFDKKRLSVTFAKDVYNAIRDIFYKYNLNKMEWFCYADNPALRGYRNFVKKFGGRECGYVRQSSKLMDGKLHDYVMFELMADDFKQRCGK